MPHEITATLMWDIYKEIMESPITIKVTDYTWERRQCGPVPALLFDDLPEPLSCHALSVYINEKRLFRKPVDHL